MRWQTLERLSVRGFKSIRALDEFELRGANVLIGANGAEKSNLLGRVSVGGAACPREAPGLYQAGRVVREGPTERHFVMEQPASRRGPSAARDDHQGNVAQRGTCRLQSAVRIAFCSTFSRMSSRRCCSRTPLCLCASGRSGRGGRRSLPPSGRAPTSPEHNQRWPGNSSVGALGATARISQRFATARQLPSALGWSVFAKSAVTSPGGSHGSNRCLPWCS